MVARVGGGPSELPEVSHTEPQRPLSDTTLLLDLRGPAQRQFLGRQCEQHAGLPLTTTTPRPQQMTPTLLPQGFRGLSERGVPIRQRSKRMELAPVQNVPSILWTGDGSGVEVSTGASVGAICVRHLRCLSPTSAALGGEARGEIPDGPRPLEEAQRVEWRLQGLVVDRKKWQVRYHGMIMAQGDHITSRSFVVAGERGTLKFWPHGHARRARRGHLRREIGMEGASADSWCAVGLFMPRGTHFRVRFFAGDMRSGIRDCYWSNGLLAEQIWLPDARQPPDTLDEFVVGVEVIHVRVDLSLRSPGIDGGAPWGILPLRR